MNHSTRRWVRGRRAFTLVELLVVIIIMSSLVVFGGAIITDSVSHFSEKAAVEQIAHVLRRAQNLARSRGMPYLTFNPATATDWYCGVVIFQGRICDGSDGGPSNVNLAPYPVGFSYLMYTQGIPLEGNLLVPNATLANLPGTTTGDPRNTLRSAVVNLPRDLVITRQFAVGGANPPITQVVAPNTWVRFQFFGNGQLDNVGAGATTLAALRAEGVFGGTLMSAAARADYEAYTFDVLKPGFGWMRVRVRSQGGIENSAIMPENTAAPLTSKGVAF